MGAFEIVDARVLDLTDPVVQGLLGITDDLVGDDYSTCQEIADLVDSADLDGVLSPGAALVGETTTVALFARVVGDRLATYRSRVERPPLYMAAHLTRIRLMSDAGPAVTAMMKRLARTARRRRRR